MTEEEYQKIRAIVREELQAFKITGTCQHEFIYEFGAAGQKIYCRRCGYVWSPMPTLALPNSAK